MSKELTIFSKYVPIAASAYCYELWITYKFEFKITKPRLSKYGDYRYSHLTKTHTITVNGDQNPYGFLITYLHEVAHLITHLEHKNTVKPHGNQWKSNFSKLLNPVLHKDVFPLGILMELENYALNPKASSCSDPDLMESINKFNVSYNEKGTQKILLKNLRIGDTFKLSNKTFIKGETRRTRVVCKEITSNKNYLVSNIAEVIKVVATS